MEFICHGNRLTAITQGADTYSFAYNGLGDRLQQTVNAATTNYTVDLNGSVTQVLADGTNTYLYGLGRIGEDAGTWAYHLPDALGSVRQIAGPAGTVTLANAYEPFGDVLESIGGVESNYGYTGEWTDGTGLVHLRARYLNTGVGRFTSKDTWEGDYNRPLSLNRWAYVEGNPVNFLDPSGRSPHINPLSSVASIINQETQMLMATSGISCWVADNAVLSGKNSRNLTGWLAKELHIQSQRYPVNPGIRTLVEASEQYLVSAATSKLALEVIDLFSLYQINVSDSLWDDMKSQTAKGVGVRGVGYLWWGLMVRDRARWDFKHRIKELLGESIMLCDNNICDWYEYSMPGNIFYAYVGRVAGFSEIELITGAIVAQQIDPANDPWTNNWPWPVFGLDQASDQAALQLGFRLYNTMGRSSNEATMLAFFKANLGAERRGLQHMPAPVDPYVSPFFIGSNGPEFPLGFFDGPKTIGPFGGL